MCGVAHMHTGLRLLHADIKPGNLLYDMVLDGEGEDGRPQLLIKCQMADLGGAVVVEGEDGRLPHDTIT